MKYKKSMIILITTIFLFSIASACASDTNTTTMAVADEQTTEEINEIEADNPASDDSKILGSSAGNEILKSGSTTVTNHTFEAIQSAIDEGYDTIYLEPGIYNGTNPIGITDNENIVNIIGNSTILDGQGRTSILFISNSNNIKIQNITFANGNDNGGGAIFVERGFMEIIDCTFTNNTVLNKTGGGAILSSLSDVKVINSTFTNNKAIMGGAIACMIGTMTAEGCIFTNNTAEDDYIIYILESNGQITTSVFTNNRANGIVYIDGDTGSTINNNIFLNNIGTPVDFYYESNTDYNWFGHNESNYKDDSGIGKCNKWLFLNATATPDTMNMSDTSNVTFTIWAYDSSTNTTTPYDKNLLKPVDLKITAEKGNLSSNTAKFDETIIYTPNSGGNSGVTASVENAAYTIYINVNKGNPSLSLVDGEVPYSENTTLTLNYNSLATGKVNITLKGKKHSKTLTDLTLNSTIDLGNVLPDEYDVSVAYSGDDSFTDATATGKLTVLKIDSDIKVKAHDINVTDTDGIMFTVTLPENATGNMTISNGKTVDVAKKGKVKKGKLIVEIKNDEYPVGEYEWTFTYLGDDIYKNSTDKATSKVLIIESKITPENKTIEMIFDDKSKVNYTTDPEGLEAIKFESTNESVVTVTSKGVIKAVGAGKAKIIIKFDGNENYTASNATVSVTVEKAKSTLTVPDVTFDYGKKGTSNTTFTGAVGINATVNDTNAVVEIDGTLITVSNLTVGTYTLTVTTVPDANHKKTTKTADITVNKADSKVSVDVPDIYYGSSANVNATYEGATGITATIAGKNLTVKDNTIIIPDDLDADPYVLTVITVPDENHNEITEYFEIYVNPANSTIDVNDAETDYGKSVDINVTYEGATGITAKLNDKNLTVKNNTITIPNDLDAGTYNLIVTTTTDSNHNPTTKTTTVTVNRINSTLTVPDITFNYGETGTATTTYTGATGVRASVNDTGAHVEINGRSITVSNLPAGTYTLTVTTIPDDNHNSTEKTAKVTVNKVDSTITAGDITFEYGLTGKTTVSYTGASGFNATIEKGTVQIEGNSIIVSGLNPGNYTLNMTTIPDVNHNAVSKSIKVKVNKATTEITAPGIITVYNINKYLTITLKDNKNSTIAGAKITVNINGAKTYTTDKNGQVKINTKTLTPKVYNAKITFAGNATHSKSQATSYILSIKATPILTAKNKTFKSTDKTKKYSVSLRNNLKAPLKKFHVKLTIGKTTYKTTTNAKGIATFKLTKLTKTSQATVKYLGNKNYNAASKKVKLTVKKVFKTISKGSKNHAMVKKIQKALISKGYYKSSSGKAYAVDGIYGDHTEKAVKQFQKAKKLKVTGKVDEKTAKKLGIIK
ncbi:peptidoglycan-binding protein [uncultured Methanobrevibacter sp.]|uniref:peptidoglycan-binding protein n=1 Tax=uncultured Methanobrevibacter sp. TaxID=253161 RepID=UPI0025D73657|nr:peptidoglycan-binding protein [uncultured Methanobrevibacter sp.]